MRWFLGFPAIFAIFRFTSTFADDTYSDPQCAGNIKNLWLDVVVVVDTSMTMTNAQLWQVRNTITQVFGEVSRIGPTKWPVDRRSTCVGIVTYDGNATIHAELDAATSFSTLYNEVQTSLMVVDQTNTSLLARGLKAAQQTLKSGRSRTYRYNFKQVVLVFAADYQGSGTKEDPLPVADELKTSGVTIITVACTKNEEALRGLQSVASPGFQFNDEMNTAKLVSQLTSALIAANCFCPSEWTQLRSDWRDTSSAVYGMCVRAFKSSGGAVGYQHAVEYCNSLVNNSYVASEFSQMKHDFILSYMSNEFPAYDPLEYYIGLNYEDSQWVWEQPYMQPKLPLSSSGWTNWAPGFPLANSSGQVVANRVMSDGITFKWAEPQATDWLFVCQVISSSTEYYTDYSVQ